jgi:hypothetical protein
MRTTGGRDVFERRGEPLLETRMYLRRVARGFLAGCGFIAAALGVGIVGYHVFGGLGWLDSLYNASMILGGMGPVDSREHVPDAEKWFASFYALFSGVAFLVIAGTMLAPVIHRFLHRFHLELEREDDEGTGAEGE